jgi:hypothetical protein
MPETRPIHPRQSEPVPCWRAKPCPFCGWVPSIRPLRGKVVLACSYQRCGVAPSIIRASERAALTHWNRRLLRTDVIARAQDDDRLRDARRREAPR